MDLGIGKFRNIEGITVLKFEKKDQKQQNEEDLVVSHHDYLPDGSIFEKAPVVGNLVKFQRQTYANCMKSLNGCVSLLGSPR